MSDPLLQLISTGLRLWIRSRCDHVGDLDLTLQGSSLGLMRGRLQGAVLSARDVRFEGLPLQHAEICSGPIQVDLTWLRPGRMLALKEPFRVSCTVSMPSQPLGMPCCRSVGGPGDWLAEQLMGLKPLGQLRIENDELVLKHRLQRSGTPSANAFVCEPRGALWCCRPRIPPGGAADGSCDQDHRREFGGRVVKLKGHAIVTPE